MNGHPYRGIGAAGRPRRERGGAALGTLVHRLLQTAERLPLGPYARPRLIRP
jgi:hypothetical protein